MTTPQTLLDLSRQPFGKWLALWKGLVTEHGQFWACICRCDTQMTPEALYDYARLEGAARVVELHEAALLEGWTQSCGCDYVDRLGRVRRYTNFMGRQVGQRLVIAERFTMKERRFLCRCPSPCHKERWVRGSELSREGQSHSCLSCARRKPLASRWYSGDKVFPLAIQGATPSRNVLYTYQTRDGKIGLATASHLRSAGITGSGGYPNQGKLEKNLLTVLALRYQGMSQQHIADALGVHNTAVSQCLKRHAADYAAYTAVMTSLPSDEEFLTGT